MNFIIQYTAKSKSGAVLAQGKVRAKNKATKFEAQVMFEEHLRKKHTDFGMLIIHSCLEERVSDIFGDIFGIGNPFS